MHAIWAYGTVTAWPTAASTTRWTGSSPCRSTGANGCAAATIRRSTWPRGSLRAEVDRHSVRRIRNNPAQALHRHTERWDNVEGIFAVRRPERLAGHHLLLVDDVLTTGATLLSCAETILRAAPDCRLSVAVLAVPQREFGLDG